MLFGHMTKSDKKYGDPTAVLNAITDNYGKPVEIGSEQDIGEFNGIFLSRVQEGLNYKKIYEEAQLRILKHAEEEAKHERNKQKQQDNALQKLDSSFLVDTPVELHEEQKQQEIKDVVMKAEETDIIDENFKGKIRSVITYKGPDGSDKIKESITDVFATILIRVIGFKEIYEAWEE